MIDIHLNNIYDIINLLTNENENLTTLRDTLLPKLISGELSINENNN
jgi:type I restriction enzyme S subunit